MKEPLDHIIRTPLPWRRNEFLTECGLSANNYQSITRDEAVAKVKEQGKQRAAMSTCMTCMNTTERYWLRGMRAASDGDDPLVILERECSGAGWGRNSGQQDLLRTELRAITALIENHRDEFDEHMEAQSKKVDLNKWRAEKQVQKQYGQ